MSRAAGTAPVPATEDTTMTTTMTMTTTDDRERRQLARDLHDLARDLVPTYSCPSWQEWEPEGGLPVRIWRRPDGSLELRYGDPGWDTDHSGDCAAGTLTPEHCTLDVASELSAELLSELDEMLSAAVD